MAPQRERVACNVSQVLDKMAATLQEVSTKTPDIPLVSVCNPRDPRSRVLRPTRGGEMSDFYKTAAHVTPEVASDERMHVMDDTCWCHLVIDTDAWQIQHQDPTPSNQAS